MNINTSNYWSASSASSNGFSGMISGMDTESMVEKMLSGTQSKIDAQKALKQQITWKQTMYRDIIQSINDFRNKYFDNSVDASSTMNFASNAFFNAMKASLTSGSGVKVISADSSALTGDMKIKVQQLATAAKIESADGHVVSSNTVTGSAVDMEKLKETLSKEMTIKIGDASAQKEVKVDFTGVTTQQEVADKINEALKSNSVSDVTAKVEDGKLVISDSKKQISGIEASDLASKMTGLSSSSKADDKGTIASSTEIDLGVGLTFDITLDGVQKNITLDNVVGTGNNGEITLDDVVTAITTKLDSAFGKGAIKVEKKSAGDALTFSFGTLAGEKGHNFRLTGADLNNLGITPGSSSNISTSTKLGDLPGANKSGNYEFTINGQKFSFTQDTTVGQMMNEINSSGAGVKISYSSLADKFVIESASTGKDFGIEMSQEKGNILTSMFGDGIISAGSKAESGQLTVGTIDGTEIDSAAEIREASITLTVNNEVYTFSLPRKENDTTYTKDEFSTEFNKYLEEKFGKDSITYDAATGDLKIKEGYTVTIGVASVVGKDGKPIDTGFSLYQNNLATGSSNLDDITNLTDDEKDALKQKYGATKLEDLKGPDVTFEDGRLVVTETGSKDLQDLMAGVQFGNGQMDQTVKDNAKGKDAIVTINGVETSRSSNTFTVDGVTVELTGVHKNDEEAVIGTVRDVDTIVEGFESFVKDYNALLDKLYGYTDAKAEYRDYAPLTDAQKKEMSDREIELWEEKAKTGLLRRDMDVEHFLSQMRIAMYEKPAGGKFGMYDIGIETGKYTDKGKLNLDTTKLRNALAQDPSSVEQLFMDVQDGLSDKLIDIMKETANPSSGSPGSLVKLAGIEGYASDGNNSLSQQLKEIEDRIKDLESKYEKEKTRYWNQFNTMEQVLANFNSQSSMIQSQFMAY